MKFLIAGFSHETNTFSSVLTDLAAFETQSFVTCEEGVAAFTGTSTTLGGFLDVRPVDDDFKRRSAWLTFCGQMRGRCYHGVHGINTAGMNDFLN